MESLPIVENAQKMGVIIGNSKCWQKYEQVVNYPKKNNRLRIDVAQKRKKGTLFAMFPFSGTSLSFGYYGRKVRDRNKIQIF